MIMLRCSAKKKLEAETLKQMNPMMQKPTTRPHRTQNTQLTVSRHYHRVQVPANLTIKAHSATKSQGPYAQSWKTSGNQQKGRIAFIMVQEIPQRTQQKKRMTVKAGSLMLMKRLRAPVWRLWTVVRCCRILWAAQSWLQTIRRTICIGICYISGIIYEETMHCETGPQDHGPIVNMDRGHLGRHTTVWHTLIYNLRLLF